MVLQQFLDRLLPIEEELRPTGMIGESRGEVDAQKLVERGEDVGRSERAPLGTFGASVGFADVLACSQPAAPQQGEAGAWPMAATVGRDVADARPTTEISVDEDGHVVEQAALVKI